VVLTLVMENNKHREFVFLDSEKSTNGTLTVPAGVMQKFIQNHSDSSDWKYLLSPDSVLKNKGVPVFFLTEKNQQKASVSSLGLAMMYRIPGFYSLGELALKQQRRESKLDFVETLFGLIKQSDHEQSRRSRVSFGDLRLTGSNTKPWEAPSAFSQPTVLNGPKPSFYPNYIVQKERGGKLSGPATTLMDSSAKLRGWKRYPVHAPASVKGVPPPPEKSQASVQTQLQPLRAGLSFAGRVRLHNVTREELGAVLWALTWGGNSELRHSLGMGKPFGLGQVSVNITQLNVRSNDTPQLGNNEIRSYVQAFERWMEKNVPAWKSVLHELLAMANPAAPGVSQLRPLKLNMAGKSEFREAKQKKLALQPYSAIR
jgi:CRISPR-associated protein (TIGR03986 family)